MAHSEQTPSAYGTQNCINLHKLWAWVPTVSSPQRAWCDVLSVEDNEDHCENTLLPDSACCVCSRHAFYTVDVGDLQWWSGAGADPEHRSLGNSQPQARPAGHLLVVLLTLSTLHPGLGPTAVPNLLALLVYLDGSMCCLGSPTHWIRVC